MIETVLGPVDATGLGVVNMHDHLLSDASALRRDAVEPAPPGLSPGRPEHRSFLQRHMLASADNLRLDVTELAAAELAAAVAAGQRTVVECTSWGLGPDHARLPQIARASGAHVVCAYGAYLPSGLPPWIAALTERELEHHLLTALLDAVPGTRYRAGMLGIMGTTAEFGPDERARLRAAARAAATVDAAVSVRLDPEARRGLDVIDLVTAEGLPASSVVFTNGDEFMDAIVWDELADTGAVIEMCFGTEAGHVGRVQNPTDVERLDFFAAFTAQHPSSPHVLGQSVWTKAQLLAYGGVGYAHLLAAIVPALLDRGMPQARVDRMLRDEPRRLLDRPAVG